MTFPVARCPGDETPLLSEALASDLPLLQLWACRDLCALAEQSAERRALIFSVSQPGNHPHNWNSIVSAVLPLCLTFLAAASGKEAPPPPVTTNIEERYEQQQPMANFPDAPAAIITSPMRMRSMAIKSPAKSALVLEQPPLVPGIFDKLHSKIAEVD